MMASDPGLEGSSFGEPASHLWSRVGVIEGVLDGVHATAEDVVDGLAQVLGNVGVWV